MDFSNSFCERLGNKFVIILLIKIPQCLKHDAILRLQYQAPFWLKVANCPFFVRPCTTISNPFQLFCLSAPEFPQVSLVLTSESIRGKPVRTAVTEMSFLPFDQQVSLSQMRNTVLNNNTQHTMYNNAVKQERHKLTNTSSEKKQINRGTHTDHPDGRHSIRTNQCPPPPSSHFFTSRTPFLLPKQRRQSTEGKTSAFGLGRRR